MRSVGQPCLTALVDVQAHAAIHGDGSKRLLLLVERGLHEVCRWVASNQVMNAMQHALKPTATVHLYRP